jgi:hypothetical protein
MSPTTAVVKLAGGVPSSVLAFGCGTGPTGAMGSTAGPRGLISVGSTKGSGAWGFVDNTSFGEHGTGAPHRPDLS